MSRAHALELVLTAEDDVRVRARWQALEQGGIASLARHHGRTHRPHLTVASSHVAPGKDVLRVAHEVWAPLLPLSLPVDGLVLLGGRRLSVADLVAAPLAARVAQARVTDAWDDADERPWIPHVTLATLLTVAQAGEALEVLAAAAEREEDARRPDTLTVRGLRWWDPEHEVVARVAGAAA
ncbi:hypothetical protein SGUI_0743 [Serinicoccus hydrothermalis]|uniref:2'-5' RNA ligase n=1 Tax=Serinicoccus hydrothermalis TaxID=1758689 RepID=A0A1B1N9N5_9MICO|nr:2'-5' RNA ligase family protein [Serinicoccus hydrothermalis]ANS78139.1 hypothetical protein SGUI_0743 [Serinicoccus hydrothermalis]